MSLDSTKVVKLDASTKVEVRKSGSKLEQLTEGDVPGFAAMELAKDPDLQQRIAEATDLPVDEIAAGAQERLEQDEDEAQAELDWIADEADGLPNQTSQAPEFAAPSRSLSPTTGSTA